MPQMTLAPVGLSRRKPPNYAYDTYASKAPTAAPKPNCQLKIEPAEELPITAAAAAAAAECGNRRPYFVRFLLFLFCALLWQLLPLKLTSLQHPQIFTRADMRCVCVCAFDKHLVFVHL